MKTCAAARAALATVLAYSSAGLAQSLKEDCRIVPQTNAPVKITDYRAYYEEGGPSGPSGIRHSVGFVNTSDKKIVAIQFGLVSFNIWNDFLDRTGGVTVSDLAPQKKARGVWVAPRIGDFSFHTGVAYVAKVRFDSGEIWTADLEGVVAELKKIEADFDSANLTKKPER